METQQDVIIEESAILEQLKAAAPEAEAQGLEIPPAVFRVMEAKIESYQPGKSLRASFPVKEEYNNPMHRMQGGMIAAAIDNTMGPLSLLVSGGAAVTLSMNLDYVRGIAAGKRLFVTATVLSRSRTNMILEAVASDERGKIVARATSQFQVFRMPARK